MLKNIVLVIVGAISIGLVMFSGCSSDSASSAASVLTNVFPSQLSSDAS